MRGLILALAVVSIGCEVTPITIPLADGSPPGDCYGCGGADLKGGLDGHWSGPEGMYLLPDGPDIFDGPPPDDLPQSYDGGGDGASDGACDGASDGAPEGPAADSPAGG